MNRREFLASTTLFGGVAILGGAPFPAFAQGSPKKGGTLIWGHSETTQTLDVHTKRSNRLKFTPDGRLVLISDLDAGDLVVIDAASRKEVKRIALGKAPEGIVVVPDGARAYVAVAGDGAVAVVDLTSLAVTRRIETGRGPDGMALITH